MSRRVKGYTYAVGADGRKHRVYSAVPPAAARQNRPRKGGKKYSYKKNPSSQIRGSGGYYNSGFVKTMRNVVPQGSFARGGAAVGGPLGGYVGGLLSKIAGFGDYKVSSNSLIGEGQSPAAMHSTSDVTRIRHREYIQDIVSSASANTFTNQQLAIQPGLPSSFPWLAPIANQYEQYIIRGMVFEFKTLFADAIASSQANSSVGGVILATDYNVLNPAFTSKQQMDNTQYTTSCKPSVSFYHPIECRPTSMPTMQFYTRGGNAPANADLRLYDLGNINVASFGIAAASVVLGELWVTYDIEFSKPITRGFTSNVLTDHAQLKGTVAAATPLGNASVFVNNSSIGGSIVGNGYVFPPFISDGSFLINWTVTGSSTASLAAPSLSLFNCSLLPVWNNDSSTAAVGGGTDTVLQQMFVVKITAPGATITWLAGGTLPASITNGDLWVAEIDSDIVN